MITVTAARQAILGAHRQFHAQVLGRIYPGLTGTDRAKAMARESRMAQSYAQNMNRRLTEGLRRIRTDPTMDAVERDDRAGRLLASERRFLGMHIAESGRRLQTEAQLYRLIQEGHTEGYWHLDPMVHRHTADCLAMGSRVWPMSVLREVNPSTRHGGCKCTIISTNDARQLGHSLTRGYMTSSVRSAIREGYWEPPHWDRPRLARGEAQLLEASIHVPIRPGVHAGDPYRDEHGRWTTVTGNLHRSLDGHMNHYLDAVERGDADEMMRRHDLMRRAALKIKDARAGDESLRTITRVHAAAINPSGRRTPVGATVQVGGVDVPVPRPVHENEGRVTGWTKDRRYAWLVPKAALGGDTDRVLTRMATASKFQILHTDEGTILQTRKGLRPAQAHASAITIERGYNELRRLRITRQGQALGDDTPLDLRADMGVRGRRAGAGRARRFASGDGYSRYPHVSSKQIGDAAELALPEVAKRLRSLGIIPAGGKDEAMALKVKNGVSPLDWQIGNLAVEVKSEAYRGQVPTVSHSRRAEGKQSPAGISNRAEKISMAASRGHLQPALITQMVDLDAGVTHVFLHRYPGEWNGDRWTGSKAFADHAIPLSMQTHLADGDLTPGESRLPQGGGEGSQTVYVGSFPLRYNPLALSSVRGQDKADIGRELAPDESADRLTRKPTDAPADVLPRGAREQPPPARSTAAVAGMRNEKTEQLKQTRAQRIEKAVSLAKSGHTQGQIAEQLGVSQSWVSQNLPAKHRPGKGARTDVQQRKRSGRNG